VLPKLRDKAGNARDSDPHLQRVLLHVDALDEKLHDRRLFGGERNNLAIERVFTSTSSAAPERKESELAQRATAARRSRPHDVDRHVGARMRERRVLVGMTQHELADLIGVTYQQAHKYEKGIDRVAAGRLYSIARALDVDIGYFYEGLHIGGGLVPSPSQRMLLDLTRNLLNIPDPRHREALATLARALAERNDRGQRAA
jgi:transcriptional regulator with XRE-family HTH domain